MRIGFRKTGKRKTENDEDVIVDNSVEIGDISGSKSENTLKKQGKTGKICPSIELETTVKPTRSIQKKKAEMRRSAAGCATKMSETARDGGGFSFFLQCRQPGGSKEKKSNRYRGDGVRQAGGDML